MLCGMLASAPDVHAVLLWEGYCRLTQWLTAAWFLQEPTAEVGDVAAAGEAAPALASDEAPAASASLRVPRKRADVPAAGRRKAGKRARER